MKLHCFSINSPPVNISLFTAHPHNLLPYFPYHCVWVGRSRWCHLHFHHHHDEHFVPPLFFHLSPHVIFCLSCVNASIVVSSCALRLSLPPNLISPLLYCSQVSSNIFWRYSLPTDYGPCYDCQRPQRALRKHRVQVLGDWSRG